MSSSGASFLTAASLIDPLTAASLTNPIFTTPNIIGVSGSGGPAPTIASSTTVAPVSDIVFISGITTIQTITPPAPITTKGGFIDIIPTGIFLTGLLGNIGLASTSVVSKVLRMTYDPTTLKWYPSY